MALSNQLYGKKDYWENRFETEENFEWCKSYDEFGDEIRKYDRASKVLIIGCGNSRLGEQMYNDGFKNITNIDYSITVIEKMKQKYREETMKWEVMNMLELKFSDASFDVVIEKGTLDVLFVDEKDPWNVSLDCQRNMKQCLQEIYRVLVAEGVFISITFAQPHFRKPLLQQSPWNWRIHITPFGEDFHFYIYTMQKSKEQVREEEAVVSNVTIISDNFDLVHHEMEKEDFLFHIEPTSP